jgi:hypothetical protein
MTRHPDPCVARAAATCVWLQDGTKITLQRDPDTAGRAWLAVEPQATIQPAAPAPVTPDLPLNEPKGAFGRYLRAARLGYHHDPVLHAWARVRADRTEPPYTVDLVPYDQLISGAARPGHYVMWWQGTDSLTTHSPRLRALGRITTPMTLQLGEYGDEAHPEPPRTTP